VVKVTDPRSVSELSDVLFLSRGNVDEPKVVGIGPKKELVCGNVRQMPIEELLVGCVNNALKVFYQGVVAFFVKGLAEFEEIKTDESALLGVHTSSLLGNPRRCHESPSQDNTG